MPDVVLVVVRMIRGRVRHRSCLGGLRLTIATVLGFALVACGGPATPRTETDPATTASPDRERRAVTTARLGEVIVLQHRDASGTERVRVRVLDVEDPAKPRRVLKKGVSR